MNLNLNECTLCGFEGDERAFWSHLIETHKTEIMTQFKKKIDNNNHQNIPNNVPEKVKSSMYTNPGPVNNSVNSKNEKVIYQQVPGNNPPNPYINNFIPNKQNYGNNHGQNPGNFDPGFPMNDPNNPYKNNPPTTRNQTKINIKESVKKPPRTERTIKYCGRINQFIKCNCCPDHICKKGNCMCVDCMRENINIFRLNKSASLINKIGKIARLNKGSYYCNCEYETIIENVIGKKFKRKSKCCFPFPPCDNCKNLEKFKDIYLRYL